LTLLELVFLAKLLVGGILFILGLGCWGWDKSRHSSYLSKPNPTCGGTHLRTFLRSQSPPFKGSRVLACMFPALPYGRFGTTCF